MTDLRPPAGPDAGLPAGAPGSDDGGSEDPGGRRWSRRRVLGWGLGGAVVVLAAGVTGLELVAHGVVPGQQELDRLDGACSVSAAPLTWRSPGPSVSGTFYSAARRRTVGYTIGYPPGYGPSSRLALVVMLHGFGGNHTTAVAGMSPAEAMVLLIDGRPLAPMAMVTVDGGRGYWNHHPDDDPMAMVVDELIPKLQAVALGAPPERIGAMGISMGGYGARLLAEQHPELISAAAAISPAIWTSYDQAHAANPGAYASAADFARDDTVTHASALAGLPVWVASGEADPFHSGVEALARALPSGAVVRFSSGCHTGPFFGAAEPGALAFLARHLTG